MGRHPWQVMSHLDETKSLVDDRVVFLDSHGVMLCLQDIIYTLYIYTAHIYNVSIGMYIII